MTPIMITTMVVCFALTISVAVSIGLASILGIQATNANMLISVKEMFNAINKFPLAAIPFFILAGNLMETGGISRLPHQLRCRSAGHQRRAGGHHPAIHPHDPVRGQCRGVDW